jgi:hypothetical protein
MGLGSVNPRKENVSLAHASHHCVYVSVQMPVIHLDFIAFNFSLSTPHIIGKGYYI